MTQRSFIFCDACNPMAIRIVEMRRGTDRRQDGRRIIDGRAWFEGGEDQARRHGWLATDDGRHICPDCIERLRSMRDMVEDRLFSPIAIFGAQAH